MTVTHFKDTVSVVLIRILLKYAENEGLNATDLCQKAGINTSLLNNNGARIPAEQFQTIWKNAAQKSGNPCFGLNFGREVVHNYHGGNFLLNVMMNCPSVRDAMEKFMRYNNLMADGIQPVIREEDTHVFLSWTMVNKNASIPDLISEALLSTYAHTLNFLTENDLHPVEVHFRHKQPENLDEYKKIFKAPLMFGQKSNEMVIERKSFDSPIFSANQELLETLEQFAQKLLDRLYVSSACSNQVIRLLGNALLHGEKTSIETIAKSLSMGVRNLQTKLKNESTSYQKLIDVVRKEIAMNYLKENNVSICDIAFLLGYSEQSAFNHAFKRWTGLTPKQYSKKMTVS